MNTAFGTTAKTISTSVLATAVFIATLGQPAAHAANLELGIFYPGASYDSTLIPALETQLGTRFASAKWYGDWSEAIDTVPASNFHAQGRIPDFIWQPQNANGGIAYADVNAGNYDAYITAEANRIKNLGYTVRITLAPEMNGDWSPWGFNKNGNTNEGHKAFYRHVVDIFRSQGATNVEWVWVPNVHTYGEVYSFADIFPGDAYVSYVGLDGYNWGTSRSWSTWQTFSEVFRTSYNDITAISTKPVIISETGSAEVGGNKAAWITDMFTSVRASYPRIKNITWFHMNKETDWRIDSSTAAKTAFSRGAAGTVTPTATPTATPAPTKTPVVTPVPTKTPVTTPVPATAVPTVVPATAAPTDLGVTATVVGLTPTATGINEPVNPVRVKKNSRRSLFRSVAAPFSDLPENAKHSASMTLLLLIELGLTALLFIRGRKDRKNITEEPEDQQVA